MPINLNRAEQIGEENKTDPPEPPESNLLFGSTEVLSINKVPFSGVSFIKDEFYQCPFCRRHAIKQILDYRCLNCESKVIAWQCYATKREEKHEMYDDYISRFYEASAARVTMLKEKYKKEGKEWPSGLESKITNPRPD